MAVYVSEGCSQWYPPLNQQGLCNPSADPVLDLYVEYCLVPTGFLVTVNSSSVFFGGRYKKNIWQITCWKGTAANTTLY